MTREIGVPFNCAGCGTELVMAMGPNAKPIPLERRSNTVYRVTITGLDAHDTKCNESGSGFLNHFVTCPDREAFRSGRKKNKDDPAK